MHQICPAVIPEITQAQFCLRGFDIEQVTVFVKTMIYTLESSGASSHA
jgi:hypothetical protein